MTTEPMTESTPAGVQYVLPGAERRLPPRPKRYASDGDQFVLPGTERISTRALLQRRMAQPIGLRCGQRPAQTTPLFRR
jgi:hypothetical protein